MRGTGSLVGLGLAASVLAGCVTSVEESTEPGDVAVAEQAIKNGSPATSFYATRSAYFGGCTGTVIGKRHVLTAAHCNAAAGGVVEFYVTWDTWGSGRVVQSVAVRPGVNPSTDDFTDINGKWANLAVVTLTSDVPWYSNTATMAWLYPGGGDDTGRKVGAGKHDDDPNQMGYLRSILDLTYSDNDSDGHFLTENEQTNPGDSGGGFFYQSTLLGDLWGDVWEWLPRNKYTSVPFHLSWILGAIGYTWAGGTESTGIKRVGSTLASLPGKARRVCQYACERTSTCVAYNHMPSNPVQCTLLSSVTGITPASYWTSAEK